MKKYLLMIVAGLFLAACGTASGEQGEAVVETFSIEELAQEPMEFEGKTVQFEGLISHICRHSGDKMRVLQTDDHAFSMQIKLGDLMNEFSVDDEGREVSVTGVFKIEVRNLEALDGADHDHDHDHEDGHACTSTEEAIRLMAEKGIDPDIRPYIELLEFELK